MTEALLAYSLITQVYFIALIKVAEPRDHTEFCMYWVMCWCWPAFVVAMIMDWRKSK